MATITNQDKRNFKSILMNIVNIIGEESERLTNGNYLEINNDLKKLFSMIDKLSNNQVYRSIVRNDRYGQDLNRRDKSAINIAKGIYTICNKCGRVVLTKHIEEHQLRPICYDIKKERDLSLFIRSIKTNRKFIIDNSAKRIQRFYRNKVKGNN